MQRTVYDQTMTPGQAKKLGPDLAAAYPSKTHETTVIPMRIGNRRRTRVVIMVKPPPSTRPRPPRR